LKLKKWLFLALSFASFSCSAADLFFIVGQAGWRDPQSPAAAPGEVKQMSWTVGAQFTPVANQPCKENCPDAAPVDGVAPAFANTWTALSKNPAHFVIFRKADAALTRTGADGKGYWSEFDAGKGIYQDALREFRKAEQSVGPGSIQHRYLIWMQNESDARAGVSSKEYKTKLIELFERFNQDLALGGKPFDAMFIVSSGLVRKSESAHFDRLNAIVQAQDDAAAEGKLVMVSRSLRRSLEDCAGSVSAAKCAARDLVRYHAWLYESLGTEMARNAFTYHSKGIKPLLPESCKRDPGSCAGTAEVYRWQARDTAGGKPVYGTDPNEFDEAGHHVVRMRFALFKDSATGRIPLYRTADGAGLGTEPAGAKSRALGYCYAAPSGNVNAKLVAMQQDGLYGFARQPADASEASVPGQEKDRTLCYVN
jgi:hypothetical protein